MTITNRTADLIFVEVSGNIQEGERLMITELKPAESRDFPDVYVQHIHSYDGSCIICRYSDGVEIKNFGIVATMLDKNSVVIEEIAR